MALVDGFEVYRAPLPEGRWVWLVRCLTCQWNCSALADNPADAAQAGLDHWDYHLNKETLAQAP